MKKLLRTKKDRQQFNDWVVALESGVLSQTTGTLQDLSGFCCLGVACALTIPEEDLKLNALGSMLGALPTDLPAPTWLKKVNDNFEQRTGRCLTHLNDDKYYTFTQIARELRKEYKDEM